MIHSKQHRGCRVQGPGTRGYRRWRTSQLFAQRSRSAQCAPRGVHPMGWGSAEACLAAVQSRGHVLTTASFQNSQTPHQSRGGSGTGPQMGSGYTSAAQTVRKRRLRGHPPLATPSTRGTCNPPPPPPPDGRPKPSETRSPAPKSPGFQRSGSHVLVKHSDHQKPLEDRADPWDTR